MLIIDNFVHADLHPGNILVTFTTPTPRSQEIFESLHTVQNHATWSQKLLQLKAEGSKPRLVLLDAGLVSSLSHRNLVNFLDLFVAITQFDGRLIARLMIERSSAPETVRDPTGFEDTMHVFLSRVKAQTTALQHIHVGEILGTVLNMVRQYHVKIEGDFVNVAVAIMLTEGMGKRLDDNVDVIQESVPILKSVKGRGDQVAELAGQVYRKAQVYSAAMSIKKRVVDLFSMVSSG